VNKVPTPLRSIRAYCLWCCNNQSYEVQMCPSPTCPLHDRKSGKNMNKSNPLTPVKSIRARCLDCSSSNPEVKNCKFKDCPLHPYRMGKNPNMKGRMGDMTALRKWQKDHKSSA